MSEENNQSENQTENQTENQVENQTENQVENQTENQVEKPDINLQDANGNTALHLMIMGYNQGKFSENDTIEIIKILFEKGIDTQIVNNEGKTALMCINNNDKIIKPIFENMIQNSNNIDEITKDYMISYYLNH